MFVDKPGFWDMDENGDFVSEKIYCMPNVESAALACGILRTAFSFMGDTVCRSSRGVAAAGVGKVICVIVGIQCDRCQMIFLFTRVCEEQDAGKKSVPMKSTLFS